MRRKKISRAKAIPCANAWIIPSLNKGEDEDTYELKVRNGTVWVTDFHIYSKLSTENFGFYFGDSLANNWEAELKGVKTVASKTCQIKPSSQAATLEFSIPKIKFKLAFDKRWRLEKEVHNFRL